MKGLFIGSKLDFEDLDMGVPPKCARQTLAGRQTLTEQWASPVLSRKYRLAAVQQLNDK
jgi:hypothetical protein